MKKLESISEVVSACFRAGKIGYTDACRLQSLIAMGSAAIAASHVRKYYRVDHENERYIITF